MNDRVETVLGQLMGTDSHHTSEKTKTILFLFYMYTYTVHVKFHYQ